MIAPLLAACAGSGAQVASATVVEALSFGDEQAFARPTQPMAFVFPRDHGPHPAYRTEWWYYTGNLVDADGAEFGYQLTFFRTALTPDMPARASDLATNQIYMAHFAVTDVAANQHASFERYARGGDKTAGAQGEPVYSVWLDAWRVEQVAPGEVQLVASTQGENGVVSIDLTLDEQGELLLHGDKGLSQRGPETGNANYYYSLVRQQTSGQIVIDGRTHAVTGLSWMDHEFGAFAPSLGAVGWDWFSATLGDGTVLMFGSFHDNQGDSRSLYGGTLGYPDGRQFALGQDDVELTPLGSWQSPTTAIRYPARWQVRIPKYNLELQITPLVADQEMRVSIVYYEGATAVEGTLDGQPIQGRGYVELTGYGETGAGD